MQTLPIATNLSKTALQPFKPENIHLALRQQKRWAPWKAVWSEKRGKWDKIPCQPNGYGLSTAKPEQWFSFEQALAAQQAQPDVFAGLGYLMTGAHGIVGVDLDNCVSGNTIAPWALEIVQQAQSYTELSPSGAGLRLFICGEVPADWTRHDVGLETYAGHAPRFLTVTGQKLKMAPAEVREAAEFLTWLAAEYPPPPRVVTEHSEMPELVDELALPALALGQKADDFLREGPASDADRSGQLFATAVELYATGLEHAQVLSVLASNPHAMEIALDHRGQDADRALAYLWKEQCLKAAAKATPRVATLDDFEDLTAGWTPEQRAAEARVAQIRREAYAKATLAGPDGLAAARREHQKRENEQIGEGLHKVPHVEVINLQQALARFVFLSDGKRVVDLFNAHYDLAFADWAAERAASVALIPQAPKELANGQTKAMPDKEIQVSALWLASRERKTAVKRTFKAGGGLFLNDPDGLPAINSWRPFDRSLAVVNPQCTAAPFVGHVEFLFGEASGRFLDWLAHIEQQPGVLPHTAWLHVAKNFGMGRNWLASVLARVWAGATAPNFDLIGTLTKGFNGQLSRKVLAVVDEIREGGGDSQWAHAEKLKSLITEETRLINPKYGRQSVEYNACRILMFSNHLAAIPIEQGDRRIEVALSEAGPKPASYYRGLYSLLVEPQFIAGVARYLGERDISGFNPGAHAAASAAKSAVTRSSLSPMARQCQVLLRWWPSDLIAAGDLHNVLTEGGSGSSALGPAHRRTLDQFGISSLPKPIKVAGRAQRVLALRNKERWANAAPDEMRTELGKASPGMDAAEYLLDLQSGA